MRLLLQIALASFIIRAAVACATHSPRLPPLWLVCFRLARAGWRWSSATRAGGRLAWWLWRRWAFTFTFQARRRVPRLTNTIRRIKDALS
jgi:hypothetical protein